MGTTTEAFSDIPFDEQLTHSIANAIPLLSEVAIAKRHLKPMNDTEHKKMIFEVTISDKLHLFFLLTLQMTDLQPY